MAKQYQVSGAIRMVNTLTMWLARRGLGQQVVLTTEGRKSGEPHSIPVSPLDIKGVGYLVSPYGEVDWVQNVRANPTVRLRQGKHDREVTLAEVPPARTGELLQAYWTDQKITRPYFDVPSSSPTPADFVKEAAAHPVFKIVT
jgi:deazaflavin-dependent oxidoreductase (nitroreductase family)